MSPAKYERLKRDVAKFEKELDRSEGEQDAILSQLQEEYGVGDLEGGLDLLAKLQRSITKTNRRFTKLMKEFNDEYGS